MVNYAVGELKKPASLLRRAAFAAALSVGAIAATPAALFSPSASAHEFDFDHPDDDNDNSGPGNGDDFDFDDFDDRSGGHDNDFDDDDHDNSGHGNGDNFDDHDDDRSGHGGGGDDDRSGHGRADRDDDYDMGVVAEEVIYSVEYDTHGSEFVPGEIIFVGRARDLALALNAGFTEISVHNLASGGVMARLGLPRGVGIDAAVAQLAQVAPDAITTPNNIYRSAQTMRTSALRQPMRRAVRSRGMLGVIDTGVDVSSLPSDTLLSQHAFAGPAPIAREHGSAVASIAVSRGVRVHVADVFGHSADGQLAASAERIAAAIDWMIAHRVAVVNISIEGPNNGALAEMVRRAAERGHIIVAAAGNGGPAARPSFPAAFEGVTAVTAIDESGRPYIRANRGPYIDFAAPGVDVSVEGGAARVSGTSFAAPVIAAEAAAHLHAPSLTESARVLTNLRARAEDLGEPGHDNIFGWGALRD